MALPSAADAAAGAECGHVRVRGVRDLMRRSRGRRHRPSSRGTGEGTAGGSPRSGFDNDGADRDVDGDAPDSRREGVPRNLRRKTAEGAGACPGGSTAAECPTAASRRRATPRGENSGEILGKHAQSGDGPGMDVRRNLRLDAADGKGTPRAGRRCRRWEGDAGSGEGRISRKTSQPKTVTKRTVAMAAGCLA
jgi:hypothetical protein